MKKTFLIILFVFSFLYLLPMEMLFISLLAMLIFEIFLRRNKCRVTLFPGAAIYIWFLGNGMAIGIYHVILQRYVPRQVLKDMVYVLFPFIFWLLGKNVAAEKKTVLTDLFIAGVIVSFCDLISGAFQIMYNGVAGMSLYQFRRMIGAGYPLTLITLFLYMSMPQEILLKKRRVYGCLSILFTDILIHFSRITILNTCVFLLYLRTKKDPVKILRYIFLVVGGVVAVYTAFPAIFQNYIDRMSNSFTEISYDQEPWDHVTIVTNWRGYEAYCEIQKFQDAGMIEKMFGGGFGAQLDVGGKAYLVTTEPTLPFLHNGYFSILMIWGVVGCIAYIFMLMVLYLRGGVFTGKERGFWRSLVVVIAVDTIFVHGLFFSTSVASLFFYLGILDRPGKGDDKGWMRD